MKENNECRVLGRFLKELPCLHNCLANLIPSYIKDSMGMGCLIAHATLSLIEAQKISNYFRNSICRLIELNNPLKSSTKNKSWNLALTISVFHDIGKLTNQYVRGTRGFKHNLLSAVIMRKALSKVYSEYEAIIAAYATLFHHEAMDWRSLKFSVFSSSYLLKTFSLSKGIQYDVSNETIEEFDHYLGKILGQLCEMKVLNADQFDSLCQALMNIKKEMLVNSGTTFYVGKELDVNKAKKARYLAPAFLLYRFLYVVDNRAASARTKYWMDLLQRIDWNELEGVAKQIYKALFRERYYIMLTAIPEKLM